MTDLLWVLGDSWADPRFYPWAAAQGWPQMLAADLGVGLVNSGTASAGYAATGGTPHFPAQAAQGWGAGATAVIVWGSLNDMLEARTVDEVRAGAATTFGLIRRLCPDAQLLVAGPSWGAGKVPAGLLACRDAVAAAAFDVAAPFLDPSGWLQGRADLMLDANHPTPDGHALIADRLRHDVALALLARPTLHA